MLQRNALAVRPDPELMDDQVHRPPQLPLVGRQPCSDQVCVSCLRLDRVHLHPGSRHLQAHVAEGCASLHESAPRPTDQHSGMAQLLQRRHDHAPIAPVQDLAHEVLVGVMCTHHERAGVRCFYPNRVSAERRLRALALASFFSPLSVKLTLPVVFKFRLPALPTLCRCPSDCRCVRS
eukprot:3228746-Rhodomonas_salina.1